MKAFDPTAITADPVTTVIEASAGTGKTTAIASLTARALAEGWVSIDQVMLVTFGTRASTELRTRLHARLSEAIAVARSATNEPTAAATWSDDMRLVLGTGADLDERRPRLEAALLDLDQATIATTHQFCHTMLLELGVLVDHDPGSRFADDLGELASQVHADQFLRHAVEFGPSLWQSRAARVTNLVVSRLEPIRDKAGVDELLSFATAIRTRMERRKRELGVHSFDDMVTRLHRALKADVTDAELPTDDPALLARHLLSDRFRWVMIDEYQDTDSLQWEIARAAFDSRSSLLLIGDPKQAIYGFRGADVQAYLRAVASSGQPSTLVKNWRSGASIVRAVSDLFRDRELGGAIGVVDVTPQRPDRLLEREGAPLPVVQLRLLQAESDDPLTNNAAFDLVAADLVAEVGRLLDSRYRDRGFDAKELPSPVGPADIAILVRTNRRGEQLRDALLRSGIQAVFSGAGSVFSSKAADDWLVLLETIDTPTVANMRRVALTSFFGHDIPSLHRLDDNDVATLALSVKEIGQVLHRSGVAAAFAEACELHQLHARLLGQDDGERILTDLRHLAQLLHDQHRRSECSIAGLASWLSLQAQGASDEGTRRLESDRRAVQIMTIHRAKGLDLPIVLVPEGAILSRRIEVSTDPAVVHDPSRRAWIDVRPERNLQQQVVDDARDEELRLLYVALTRAKYALRIWWSPAGQGTHHSPLHRLLADPATPGQSPRVPHGSSEVRVDQAQEFCSRWQHSALNPVVVTPTPMPPPRPPEPQAGVIVSLREFSRDIDRQWRRTSYSALTSGLHEHPAVGTALVTDEPDWDPEADSDPEADPADVPPPSHQTAAKKPVISPMAQFPGGTLFGTLVHSVLEDLDPHSSQLTDELLRASSEACLSHPIEGVDPVSLAAGLHRVVTTPLGELADGRSLADYPTSDRLAELDFELPLAATTAAAATVGALAQAFIDHLDDHDPLAGYGAQLAATEAAATPLSGWLTGSIDAVLRHTVDGQPRHLVVDYKTNRMPVVTGEDLTVQHYGATAMAEAMMQAHYPLQALLYCVALHRFLGHRLPGYDPQLHLGGVGYLFVRGMAGDQIAQPADMPWGVFSWRPPTALVLAADKIVSGRR